jgi:hypothetical protein
MSKKLYSNEYVYIIANDLDDAIRMWNNSLYFDDSKTQEFQKIDDNANVCIMQTVEAFWIGLFTVPGGAEWVWGSGEEFKVWQAKAVQWVLTNNAGYLGKVLDEY